MQRMQHQERPSVRRAGPGAPGQALRSNVWAAILTFFVSSQKMCWTIILRQRYSLRCFRLCGKPGQTTISSFIIKKKAKKTTEKPIKFAHHSGKHNSWGDYHAKHDVLSNRSVLVV
jgi:hypothetical protein